MSGASEAIWEREVCVRQTQRILDSFASVLGRQLLPRCDDLLEEARALFEAPFVVVSHGVEDDPILNYGNRLALQLWETSMDALTQTPSRLTAEPVHRDQRAQMLDQARRDGFIDNYQGIRISTSGKRFQISNAIVWRVLDEAGAAAGQAATFSEWKHL